MNDDEDYILGLIDGFLLFGNLPKGWYGLILVVILALVYVMIEYY